jgi:branched-chain amino acid transport system ATP-binding protein
MLQVETINVAYGIVPTLHQVCLAVEAGETVCLLGLNSAGKTTTVKSIIGLLNPTAGQIRFQGRDITGLPPHRTVELGISLAPEGRLIFPAMSVVENLELGASTSRARAHTQGTAAWVYSLFPALKARQGQAAGTLSGGEQQMLARG